MTKVLTAHVTHGTASTYSNYACRCDPCKEAMRRKSAARYRRNLGLPENAVLPARTRTLQPKQVTCTECGISFDALLTSAKYCSERCRDKAKLRDRPTRPCERCSKPFHIRTGTDRVTIYLTHLGEVGRTGFHKPALRSGAPMPILGRQSNGLHRGAGVVPRHSVKRKRSPLLQPAGLLAFGGRNRIRTGDGVVSPTPCNDAAFGRSVHTPKLWHYDCPTRGAPRSRHGLHQDGPAR